MPALRIHVVVRERQTVFNEHVTRGVAAPTGAEQLHGRETPALCIVWQEA